MYRDPSEFRERFKAYKEGKSVREIYGLPGYHNGKFSEATKKKINYYYNKLLANGFDPMSAAGILGNIMQESSLNPDSVNELGYSGLLLNSKAIQRAIIDQYDNYDELSLLRYLSDWTDGATWIRKGPHAQHTALYSKSYRRKGYKTPEEAAFDFLKKYERAIVVDPKTKKALRDANGNYIYQDKDKRLGYARDIYNYVTGGIDRLAKQIEEVGTTQPEPIIINRDAVKVPSIPTVKEQTVPSTWMQQATELPKYTLELNFELNKPLNILRLVDAIDAYTPTWEGLKQSYSNGKLPGYLGGLTPEQKRIQDLIVQNQGTIQQGGRWSPISEYRTSHSRDYNKPFWRLFLDGAVSEGLGTIERFFGDLNRIAKRNATPDNYVNFIIDTLPIGEGFVTKGVAKLTVAAAKRIAKRLVESGYKKKYKSTIKPKAPIKTVSLLSEHHTKHPEELTPLKSELYDNIQTYVFDQTNYKHKKATGKELKPVKDKAYTAEFPEETKIAAYHGPNRSVFDKVAAEHIDKFKIMGPHEYHHLLEDQIKYTPLQASLLELAYPFSLEFKNAHPNFDYLRERAAMNSELMYAVGEKYGFPLGEEFDKTVKNISPWELEDIASSLSAYNKDASRQRQLMFGGVDVLPKPVLKDALLRVPMGTALYAGAEGEYKNGKLPRYGGGRITTGGAGVTSVYQPAPTSEEAQPTIDALERIANFLPYVGTIQDWDLVGNGNIGKIPSAVIGTIADIFLPGLRSSYKAAKAYEAMYKATPKIADKIKYYKASLKAYRNTSSNVGYLFAGLFEDILDDLGYQYPLFTNKDKHQDEKLPGYSNGKIRIKPANRGKFNATKKRTGKTTEELTHSKNPLTRKRAIFALNAKKWNHK